MRNTLKKSKRGLTLIELLVIVTIIGVLAAMIPCVPGRTRETARRVCCVNNLKQIGLAIAQYYEDNQKMPPNAGPISYTNLAPYLGNAMQPFHCRCDLSKRSATNFTQFASNPSLYSSYWYCPSSTWQNDTNMTVMWDRGICTPGKWPANSPHKGEGGNVLWNDGHVDWNRTFPTNLTSAGVVQFQ